MPTSVAAPSVIASDTSAQNGAVQWAPPSVTTPSVSSQQALTDALNAVTLQQPTSGQLAYGSFSAPWMGANDLQAWRVTLDGSCLFMLPTQAPDGSQTSSCITEVNLVIDAGNGHLVDTYGGP